MVLNCQSTVLQLKNHLILRPPTRMSQRTSSKRAMHGLLASDRHLQPRNPCEGAGFQQPRLTDICDEILLQVETKNRSHYERKFRVIPHQKYMLKPLWRTSQCEKSCWCWLRTTVKFWDAKEASLMLPTCLIQPNTLPAITSSQHCTFIKLMLMEGYLLHNCVKETLTKLHSWFLSDKMETCGEVNPT